MKNIENNKSWGVILQFMSTPQYGHDWTLADHELGQRIAQVLVQVQPGALLVVRTSKMVKYPFERYDKELTHVPLIVAGVLAKPPYQFLPPALRSDSAGLMEVFQHSFNLLGNGPIIPFANHLNIMGGA